MKNLKNFQNHPYHLVSPSHWPILTSFALLSLTISGVLSFHGFNNGGYLFIISLINLIIAMFFWFRDIISEGIEVLYYILVWYTLKIARAVSKEEINNIKKNIDENNFNLTDDQLGYYLAGLIEGDGCINIPAKGKTTLNRILNPRIILTGHRNNTQLFIYLQSRLNGIGRLQYTGENVVRYIIGDIKGMLKIINLVHGKFRTPKNITLNSIISSLNTKYYYNIPNSPLDSSKFENNSWLSGFTEADGYFGVKIINPKPKSETRKRATNGSINLVFRIDQRLFDKATNSSLLPFMKELSQFLNCNLLTYNDNKVLSVSLTPLEKLNNLIIYFNKFPLLGIKGKDFKDWEKIYNMMIADEHLTESGKEIIKSLQANMNKNRKI